jgi:hypothetical protein
MAVSIKTVINLSRQPLCESALNIQTEINSRNPATKVAYAAFLARKVIR